MWELQSCDTDSGDLSANHGNRLSSVLDKRSATTFDPGTTSLLQPSMPALIPFISLSFSRVSEKYHSKHSLGLAVPSGSYALNKKVLPAFSTGVWCGRQLVCGVADAFGSVCVSQYLQVISTRSGTFNTSYTSRGSLI